MHNAPYYIERKDIADCLNDLGKVPLKLMTDSLFARPGVRETPWEHAQWGYGFEGDTLVKPVFVLPKDVFQFSVADAQSKQEWHFHRYVFEIFLSDSPIQIAYKTDDASEVQTAQIENGVLIVPPGLAHKVTLNGLTYVFQATLATDDGIGGDKVLTPQWT